MALSWRKLAYGIIVSKSGSTFAKEHTVCPVRGGTPISPTAYCARYYSFDNQFPGLLVQYFGGGFNQHSATVLSVMQDLPVLL